MVLYKGNSDEHNAAIVKSLNELRSTFHDVTLTVGDQTVNAHKNILIIGSDYFRAFLLDLWEKLTDQMLTSLL